VENNGTGGWLIDDNPLTVTSWITAFGGDPNPSSGGGYHFNTPDTQAAFSYIKKSFDQGCYWVGRKPDPFGYFAARLALFITAGPQDVPLLEKALGMVENDDEWVILNIPSTTGDPVPLISGLSLSILQSSPKEQLAAWIFIRWLVDPEIQAKLVSVSYLFPSRLSTMELLEENIGYPGWNAAFSRLSSGKSVPVQPSWRMTRNILRDAFKQLFLANISFDQVPMVLEQLDATIEQTLGHSP
jgi:multiple sugar transport system substrate-binding protein